MSAAFAFSSAMKNQKYIVMILLALSFLVAISIKGLTVPVLAKYEIGDPLLFNSLNTTSVAALVLGIGSFVLLNRHPIVVGFTNECVTELRAVFWPDKEETIRSTTVVIGVTLFIAFMLGLYDYVWAEVTQLLLFTES
jgi:preprotein translocase SecE subunit